MAVEKQKQVTGRGSDQFVLRLPDGMRERIKAVAEQNSRSMNAEIIALLESAMSKTSELRIRRLESEVSKFEARSEAFMDVYKIALGVLSAAIGDDPRVFDVFAREVVTMKTGGGMPTEEQRETMRRSIVQRVVQEIERNPKPVD